MASCRPWVLASSAAAGAAMSPPRERGARGDAREVHVLLEQRRQAGAQLRRHRCRCPRRPACRRRWSWWSSLCSRCRCRCCRRRRAARRRRQLAPISLRGLRFTGRAPCVGGGGLRGIYETAVPIADDDAARSVRRPRCRPPSRGGDRRSSGSVPASVKVNASVEPLPSSCEVEQPVLVRCGDEAAVARGRTHGCRR